MSKGLRELFFKTRTEQFAVPAFNIDNWETLKAVAMACASEKAPCLVEVSETEVSFLGMRNIRDLVSNLNKELNLSIYLNLDHNSSVDSCIEAIDIGFELVHLDITKNVKDIDEITKKTKEVVKYAHSKGALVEGEMEYFLGSSTVHDTEIDYEEVKKHFTDPEKASRFVNETGIDNLAISIGNLHGLYKTPKILDIELLKELRSKLDCFFSLHGGSGTPLETFKEASKFGVSKININSELRKIFREGLFRELDNNRDEYAVIKLEEPVIEELTQHMRILLQTFGTSGKLLV